MVVIPKPDLKNATVLSPLLVLFTPEQRLELSSPQQLWSLSHCYVDLFSACQPRKLAMSSLSASQATHSHCRMEPLRLILTTPVRLRTSQGAVIALPSAQVSSLSLRRQGMTPDQNPAACADFEHTKRQQCMPSLSVPCACVQSSPSCQFDAKSKVLRECPVFLCKVRHSQLAVRGAMHSPGSRSTCIRQWRS